MAFSIREVGPTLEVTPHVSANGQWITLSIVPQRVELLGFDSFQTGKTAGGASYNIPQPRYFTTKTEAKLKLRNGQRCLIGVYKLVKPENQIEFFILQAVATPTK
jgi:type II secretory pathway component GspD/PulD (secretin)